jgi:hypothetical protein
VREIKKERGR